jgi:signal transduction histidine kinase
MTIRRQITIVIVMALVTVFVLVGPLEKWLKRDFPSPDLASMSQQASAVARLMNAASAEERQIVLQIARRAGWRVSLVPNSIVEQIHSSSAFQPKFEAFLDWFFPPRGVPPLGGWHTFLHDIRVVAMPIDEGAVLIFSGLPDAMLTSSFLGQGSYYLVALVVLFVFFFIFAMLAITEPIRRISDAAMEADLKNWLPIFEERGTNEIVALARALNGMRNRIRTMMDTRTRMLRGIGHDLRTPLTRLKLRAERMDEGSVRIALLSDIDRIDKLLTQSLNFLRDDYTTETIERVDVASILSTVCCDFSDVGFAVRYVGPNKLIANCRPLSIGRAVTNLCDNAVKFASTVEVRLSQEPSGFAINVCDDGPGIPPSLRERVFEPFFKADSARTDGKSGFGLGLSIVSEIARSHQGSIELLSGSPRGLIARMVVSDLSAK